MPMINRNDTVLPSVNDNSFSCNDKVVQQLLKKLDQVLYINIEIQNASTFNNKTCFLRAQKRSSI
jgi:hypothetical protein